MGREVVGVVGAGTMGAGIAQLALEAGHETILHDVDANALAQGRERIRDGLARRASRLELDADSIDEWVDGRLAGLREAATLDAVAGGSDVVVEAALEDLELKRTIFRALDAAATADAILATNTSALSVSAIAESTTRQERVVGLHFFNPAPVMELVEVASGARTDRQVADRAAGLATSWGKTAIRTGDSPGFVVNRVNRPFFLEALAILDGGEAPAPAIDDAVREAGFRLGPFELMDLIGLDVNLATTRGLHAAFGGERAQDAERFRPSPTQLALVERGRLGRKTGSGFYRYAGGRRTPAPVAARPPGRPLDPEAIVDRIVLAVIAEAWRALDDGVATAADIDLAMRLGAAHPSGPFARIDQLGGPPVVLERLRALAAHGPRFEPPAGLVAAAERADRPLPREPDRA